MLKTQGTRFLPDEIIIIIISFLPAKSAMRFRLVCRSWRDLTLSRDFVDSHLNKSLPTIFVSNLRPSRLFELFTLDKWWEPARTTVHRFPLYSGRIDYFSRPLFSHGGVVVFQQQYYRKTNFFILNPARPSHEYVTIALSYHLWRSKIYGVYFHPSLKEYCSLLKIEESAARDHSWNAPTERIQYKVLNLGPNPFMKAICYPFSNRVDDEDATPLLFNNYLYWLLKPEQEDNEFSCHNNDIMEFDIVNEVFMVIPCPVPFNTECNDQYQTNLLNIDGILSFLLIVPNKISIWRLEDRAQQLWTTSEYYLNISDFPDGIAVVDRKLAFLSERRLVVCDLTDGTVKRYPEKNRYSDDVFFLSHRMSLASLNKCEPNISVEQHGGEVVVRAGSNYRIPLRRYFRRLGRRVFKRARISCA